MDYKTAKEAFVSDTSGSSIFHINLISLVALSSIALHSTLITRLPPSRSIPFLKSCLILVFPLLLSMTIFATSPILLSLLVLFPVAPLLLIPPRESAASPLPSLLPQSPSTSPRSIALLPSLTIYRAHMLLMTTLAILAVDFPVFPRELAKCETFGVSLMDLGVGSFVFSQGVVSSIPLLKDSAYLTAPLRPKLISTIKKTLPVIFIGLLRVLLVKGTEYPEHESEYGTHWNFFLTLALLPIFQVTLHSLIRYIPISLIGILVALSHQISLSSLGLELFILDAPRTSIISANKEGIASLPGYLSIHLLGLSAGTLILPSSPNLFRRRQKATFKLDTGTGTDTETRDTLGAPRQNDKTATELFSYTVLWWVILGGTSLLAMPISRRMANLPYVFWVAAFNTSFILGYLLLDLIFFPSPLSKSTYSKTSKLKVHVDNTNTISNSTSLHPQHPPALLEAFNNNGLALFLLANVATGLVNMALPTMYMSAFWAMVVLSLYAVGVCAAAWGLRSRRLLRF